MESHLSISLIYQYNEGDIPFHFFVILNVGIVNITNNEITTALSFERRE
jgi:hypothetical protein